MPDRFGVEFVGEIPPFVKALIRGGGKSEHDIMKLAAWSWLRSERYELIDFEAGGFDVLGIYSNPSVRPQRAAIKSEGLPRSLRMRVVIDAKTSQSDLYNHFKKEQIPNCDLEEKFSVYGNLHYIIARKGVIKQEAVHPPWGLLEYDGTRVLETKKAAPRAFVGNDTGHLFELAQRAERLLRAIVANPSIGIKLEQRIDPAILKEKDRAEAALLAQHEELAKALQVFEYLHGYNPVRRLMGDE